MAAAYGAVPADRAPLQTARDAEDYVVFMAGTITSDPVKLYIDCQGTVADALAGPQRCTRPGHRVAHLWGSVFARFDNDMREVVQKILGHATEKDVADGRTTAWEKCGNAHADRLAKRGPDCMASQIDTLTRSGR